MRKILLGFAVVMAGVFFSCSKDKNAVLQVRLTDAPADYDKVLIDIRDVQIHASTDEKSGKWQSLNVEAGVYNLLDFRNGMDTLLASLELPAGKVSQMRLILGPNNKVVKNGTEYVLDAPSAQQSGLKFNIHADLTEGVTYRMWIDFDAARSIVRKGNGGYSLKPVIRPFTEATSGAIKGTIAPAGTKAAVMAIANGDTLGAIPAADGKFLIRGVAAGTWKVVVEPENLPVKTLENVEVSVGKVTELGTVQL